MIIANLSGAFDLILGRERGLQKLDFSADGFWQSFVGLGLAGIVDAIALYATHPMRLKIDDTLPPSAISFAALSLLVALLSYVGAMAALYFLCRTAEIQARFPNALVAHNWAAPLVSLGFLPFILVSTSLWAATHPEPAGLLQISLVFIPLGFLVLVAIRLIRIPLQVDMSHAVGLFLGSGLVSIILASWLEKLFGV